MNLCRVCLGNDAVFPLFENFESEDCDLLSRLTLCVNEKIEDIEGYPRNICKSCKDTIEMICSFISKYRESTSVLASRIPGLKDNYFNDHPQIEISIGNIKNELESDHSLPNDTDNEDECLPLMQLKLKDEIKTEKIEQVSKPIKAKSKGPKRITIKQRTTKNDINKIASSILEGDFAWIGDVWCIKSTKPVVMKEKEDKRRKPKRKQLLVPKTVREPKPLPVRLCDLCGEIFKDQDKLNMHKRKVHYNKTMKCPHCPRILVSQYYLNRHLKRRHDSNGRSFTCPTCGKAFAFQGELTTHIRNVHNKHLKPKKVYTCKICNKSYKCSKSVLVHERSVHTGLRPAVCEICGTSFYHDDYLKEHMRLHTGETPFKCPICGRGYAQRCNMKSHLRIHRISELDAITLSKLRPNYLKLLKV